MAMLAKPLEDEPGLVPDRPALVKKPYAYNPEDYIPIDGKLSLVESHRLQATLQGMLGEEVERVTAKPPLKLVSSAPEVEDDRAMLDAWLASYCPIRFDEKTRQSKAVCLIADKAKHEQASLKSSRVRNILHHTNRSSLKENVWVPVQPVKGWSLGRPPTLEQLYSRTRRHSEELKLAKYDRQDRIEQLKAKYGWDKPAPVQHAKVKRGSLVDEMFFVGPPRPANDETTAPVNQYETRAHMGRLEDQRYQSWLLRNSEYWRTSDPATSGLKWFFESTGVPENGPQSEIQAALEQESLSQDLQYGFATRPLTEEDRLNEWLLEHYEFKNALEVPYKYVNDQPISMFDRKCHSLNMLWNYSYNGGGISVENMNKIRNKSLFKPSEYNWKVHTNRVHPLIAVGEPYGEWDREDKLQLVREENAKQAKEHRRLKDIAGDPNFGKVWPGLGLPKTSVTKVDEVTDRLARRISEQVMSVQLVREVIQEEISDYTAAICAEFEVAMEDLVDRVRRDITSPLEVNQRHSNCPQGYFENDLGLIVPNSLKGIYIPDHSYGQAKVA